MGCEKTKLPRRSWLTLILLFLLIPAALIFCPRLGGQIWYFTSLLIIALTLCAFFLVFEARRPQARELVVLAVLSHWRWPAGRLSRPFPTSSP